jgi:hypothetical protein
MTHVLVRDPLDLDPEAPGLDEDTRRRRRSLAKMRQMSLPELQNLAVRAGILTPDGELTEPYKDMSPSPYREALSDNSLDLPILEVLRSTDVANPRTYQAVVDELRSRWAVNEDEVLVRPRRMKALDFVEEREPFHFSITAKGYCSFEPW